MIHISRRKFLAASGATAAVSALALHPLSALADPTSAEVQAEADEVKEELEGYQQQLDEASDAYYQAIDEHDAAIEAMDAEQVKIDEANAQLAVLQEHLGTRATSMYKDGSPHMIEVLLGSRSFEDFTNTWSFLQQLNARDSDNIAQTEVYRQQAQDAHDEYARQEQIAADKLAEAEATQAEAERIVEECQARLDSLNEQVEELLEQERIAASQAVGYTGSAPADANTIVQAAYSQLGVPYVWGGTSPGVGLDCSGLVQYCYACAGISLPRHSQSQRSAGTRIPVSSASPGDILGNSHHVAIYIGGGSFIHAPYTGTVVQISSNLGQFVDATHIG